MISNRILKLDIVVFRDEEIVSLTKMILCFTPLKKKRSFFLIVDFFYYRMVLGAMTLMAVKFQLTCGVRAIHL